MHLVPISAEQDAYYFGKDTVFSGLNLNIGTLGNYNASLAWEYYNNSTSNWEEIPNITDNTNGFTQNGMVLFSPPRS